MNTAVSPPIPRFGHTIVAAAFVTQGVAIGISLGTYPVFMASIESEFGLGRAQASMGIPILLATGAILSPWIGRQADRGSPRRIMLTGAILMAVGLAGIAFAEHLAFAAALWIGLVGAGHAMFGPLPAMTMLNNWFVARRSTMIAIAAMGTTAGGAIAPPLAELLIQRIGWRGALTSLGALTLLIAVPVVLAWVVKRPEDVGQHPDGAAQAPPSLAAAPQDLSTVAFLREPRYWLVGGAFAVMNGIALAFLTHIVPIAGEHGIPRDQAVLALSLNALCTSVGKIAFGVFTDRVGPRNAGRVAATLQVLGWVGILSARTPTLFIASAGIFAFGLGCMIPCQAAFVARIFGSEHFGRASGMLGLLTIVGAMAIPISIGAAYESTGNYAQPLLALAAGAALPLLLFSAVRLPSTAPSPAEATGARSL